MVSSKKSSGSGGGFTSLADMFDGGGMGRSGSGYSTKSRGREDSSAKSHENTGTSLSADEQPVKSGAAKEVGISLDFVSFKDMCDA